MDFSFETFLRLKERRRQLAGSMSGGEQQMLALARALMVGPRIPLVDELSIHRTRADPGRTHDR
ncbi:MAG: ATP-binding cassette domain-containing protein [Rhodoplanes sp.]